MRPMHWLAAAGAAGLLAPAWGQDAFSGCVPAGEGALFQVRANDALVEGVVLGQGRSGVVFSNTARGDVCTWLPLARELVGRGHQVGLWLYGGAPRPSQTAELKAAVAQLQRRGVERVVLVGGSRGGCLSMMAASEIGAPVAGVAMLSCAAVFNRGEPVPTAPWVARLTVPLLHLTGEHDAVPTIAEARAEMATVPVADKRLVVLPTGAHGDQLLVDREHGPAVRRALVDFVERLLR